MLWSGIAWHLLKAWLASGVHRTRLCTDAGWFGLGFTLQQQSDVLVKAGSCFLSDSEGRYATIELELLAVMWAIHKCNIFLAGLPHFTVVTDHHPLISILNNHRLDEIVNPHLQHLKTRVMAYNFTAEWIKGALNNALDALSCYATSSEAIVSQPTRQEPSTPPDPAVTRRAPRWNPPRSCSHPRYLIEEIAFT